MSAFDRLYGVISGAVVGYDLQPSDGLGHQEFCLCHRCVFVRGVRGELAAFAKSEAKAEKKRGRVKLDPMVDAVVSGSFPNYCPLAPHYRECPRFKAKGCDAINCKAEKKRAK